MKISVITPSLNSGQHIERAIQSVLAQEYDNFEHIIIDGLSTDNTIDILKRYPHLKWISEKDNGQSDAMNKGFSLSNGDIIVYLNSDDTFLEGAFKTIIHYFEKDNSVDCYVGKVQIINQDGSSWVHDPNIKMPTMLEHWKHQAFPCNPVQYFYKRKVQETFSFNMSNHLAMDHEFLLNMVQKFTLKRIPETLGVFYMLEGSKTVEGFKNASTYWTYKTFSYIDRFLSNYPNDYILNYKKEQFTFFLEQITSQHQQYHQYINTLKEDLHKFNTINTLFHPIQKYKMFEELHKRCARL